jgi:Rps23 Pro-64 3,4-dihydroxylase Tpa1-like proline 4-hydroxylase
LSREILDFDRCAELARQYRANFESADPFPHVVMDDFLDKEIAEPVVAEFSEDESSWAHYHHYNQRKQAITNLEGMGPRTRGLVEALQSDAFVRVVEQITGLTDLFADPYLDGAGMHKTLPGGHLNMHTDFLSHPNHKEWSRQINLLLYFNPEWKEEWMGNLEFWDRGVERCVQSIEPLFNRCVIFQTSDISFHGHPQPLACPDGMSRNSIALYYFQKSSTKLELHPTTYHSRPADSKGKRWMIGLDTFAVRLYSMLRRYGGLRDKMLDRILKHF